MADLKVKVGVDKSGFTTGLASMENSVKGFGNKVGGILAGAFAFDKIIKGFSNAIDKGDQLQDLANRFGIAASSLQEIGNAASTSGAGLEDVASAMNKLAKNAGEALGGNETMAASFAKIGLSLQDLQTMSPQDLFMALSKAMSGNAIPETLKLAIASDLAGKSVGSLMETLRMGPEAISANGQAMGVWSDETIAKLSAASDAMKTFENKITNGFGNVLIALLPLVEGLEGVIATLTMLGSAAFQALGGNFSGAKEIVQSIPQMAADLGNEKLKRKRDAKLKGLVDTEGSSGLSAAEDKAFEKSEQAAARHELKLIESQISGKEEAEKMKAAIEEKYRQRSLDREIAMANRKAELIPQIEDLQAQRGGAGAEMKLLEERAAAASAQARTSGGAEDVFSAQKLAVELQKSKEQMFSQAGFGDQSFSRAKSATERIVGNIPQASQLRDIPSSTEAQRTQPVKLENPPDLKGIMDKLDTLIKNAGVFS